MTNRRSVLLAGVGDKELAMTLVDARAGVALAVGAPLRGGQYAGGGDRRSRVILAGRIRARRGGHGAEHSRTPTPAPGTTRRRQSDQRVTAAHLRHEEEPRDFAAADARPHSKGGPDRTPPREPRPGEAGNTKGRRRLPRGGSLEFRPGGCPRRAPQRPRASRDGNMTSVAL